MGLMIPAAISLLSSKKLYHQYRFNMCVQASSWAWNQSLSGKELVVLLYLSDKAGDNGLSWYGRTRISDKCGMSKRSVSRAMESLESKGFIRRYKRFTEDGDQTSNATVVLFEGRIEEDDLGMMKDKNSYSPMDIGLTELTPPLVSTDNTPLSGLTTKTTGLNVSRVVSKSTVRACENFPDRVMTELLADNLPVKEKRYAGMKITEFQERWPHSESVGDCWAYVLKAVNHKFDLTGE